jgi:hypothetical protein
VSESKDKAINGTETHGGNMGCLINRLREGNEANTCRIIRGSGNEWQSERQRTRKSVTSFPSLAVLDEGFGVSEAKAELGTLWTTQSKRVVMLEWSHTSAPRIHALQRAYLSPFS